MENRHKKPAGGSIFYNNKEDFRNGWDVFPEVVKILKPDYCLFIGLIASYSFNIKMKEKGLSYEPVSWMEKINGACPILLNG